MGNKSAKIAKKAAKAEIKKEKARAKIEEKEVEAMSGSDPQASLVRIDDASRGVKVSITSGKDNTTDIMVKGLTRDQADKIIPHINKEILITLTAEKKPFKASLMRFIKEGLWDTAIKIIAGLVVAYILISFGLK